jgi:beta-glucanase (GH16 family)
MPKGDIAGWKQVFADDFTGSTPGSKWGSYSGQPGGNPAGWWMPSHTTTQNGKLTLDGYLDGGKNASGGTSAWSASQLTYGKYEVRFRADVGRGYGYAFLLWPASGKWPVDGEIDFAEDGGTDRQGTTATLHYGASNSQIARDLKADFSSWHTIGVEWTAGKLVYTLDGKPWSTVTGSMVPSTPMFLAVQQMALPCTQWTACVDSTTPAHTKIEIDWVAVYSPSSTATPAPSTSTAGLIALPLGLLAAVSPAIARTRRPSRRRATT